ncbi:CPBP family intramembrane glutamic endopeptidase [Massilia sp. AB1]|uniref:CPBP family intramembrane glutamic endopeptidase n=1 Tax=Massilia sp. AB1 TaxID=2823371 RepID=UPI001E2D457E|nr:type II CAAX endopeptidase family protein [Massilia sp. AB1]
MNEASTMSANKAAPSSRLMAHPFVRSVIGIVLTFAPVPLTMILSSALVDKPYRIAWPQLLAAVLSFLAYRFFVHRIEKRALTEFGAQGAARESLLGLGLGAGLVCAVFALLGLLGAYHLDGMNTVTLLLALPLAELMLVALTEEMLFRGVVFRISEQSIGSRWAIIVSAVVFSAAHLPNDGVSPVAVAALAVYSVMQAAIFMRTRRLWMCIASHLAWNYFVGQIFSATVSGHQAEAGLLRGELSGSILLTGGAFGVEGSVVTLVVLCAAAAWFLRGALKRGS